MRRLQRSVYLSELIVTITLLIITALIPAASAGTCPKTRWVPVPKIDYLVPAYPEENTTYWVFDFDTYKNMKLEIKGQFPFARYMNLILYDFNGGEVATYEYDNANGHIIEQQVLEDRDIIPDSGNFNPYLPNADRDEKTNRNYTIYVVRADNDSKDRLYTDGTPMENTLVIPSDLAVAAIFLRVYMPDNKRDNQGDVSLPDISVINLNTGLGSPCPGQQLALPDRLTGGLLGPDVDQTSEEDQATLEKYKNDVFSYNPGHGWALYPNGENPYLLAPLWHTPDRVATVKFKAPTFTATRKDPSVTVNANDEVRYFSVCMGGYKMTNTSECISDEELKIDADGYVRIAVVPNGEKIKYILDPVWNVFKWGQHQYPALLFRQIGVNPDFEKSFRKTDDAFHTETIQEMVDNRASTKIEEYAPEGIYCELNEFEDNRCGM